MFKSFVIGCFDKVVTKYLVKTEQYGTPHSLKQAVNRNSNLPNVLYYLIVNHIWVSFSRTGIGPELCHLKKKVPSERDGRVLEQWLRCWFVAAVVWGLNPGHMQQLTGTEAGTLSGLLS